MRTYVVTTGLMFALLVVAHAARLAAEGPAAFHSPVFVIASLLSIGMLAWSVLVFLGLGRRPGVDRTPGV
jgi:hypothetical protein